MIFLLGENIHVIPLEERTSCERSGFETVRSPLQGWHFGKDQTPFLPFCVICTLSLPKGRA